MLPSTRYYWPESLRDMPLNDRISVLLDFTKRMYFEEDIDLIQNRWDASLPTFNSEVFLAESNGAQYIRFFDNNPESVRVLCRMLTGLYRMKGTARAVNLLLNFLGVQGTIISYFKYQRELRLDTPLSREWRSDPEISALNPCDIIIQVEIRTANPDFAVDINAQIRELLDLYTWTCSNLVGLFVRRTLLDLTMPTFQSESYGVRIEKDGGTSIIEHRTPRYGELADYGDGSTYTIPGDSGIGGMKDNASVSTGDEFVLLRDFTIPPFRQDNYVVALTRSVVDRTIQIVSTDRYAVAIDDSDNILVSDRDFSVPLAQETDYTVSIESFNTDLNLPIFRYESVFVSSDENNITVEVRDSSIPLLESLGSVVNIDDGTIRRTIRDLSLPAIRDSVGGYRVDLSNLIVSDSVPELTEIGFRIPTMDSSFRDLTIPVNTDSAEVELEVDVPPSTIAVPTEEQFSRALSYLVSDITAPDATDNGVIIDNRIFVRDLTIPSADFENITIDDGSIIIRVRDQAPNLVDSYEVDLIRYDQDQIPVTADSYTVTILSQPELDAIDHPSITYGIGIKYGSGYTYTLPGEVGIGSIRDGHRSIRAIRAADVNTDLSVPDLSVESHRITLELDFVDVTIPDNQSESVRIGGSVDPVISLVDNTMPTTTVSQYDVSLEHEEFDIVPFQITDDTGYVASTEYAFSDFSLGTPDMTSIESRLEDVLTFRDSSISTIYDETYTIDSESQLQDLTMPGADGNEYDVELDSVYMDLSVPTAGISEYNIDVLREFRDLSITDASVEDFRVNLLESYRDNLTVINDIQYSSSVISTILDASVVLPTISRATTSTSTDSANEFRDLSFPRSITDRYEVLIDSYRSDLTTPVIDRSGISTDIGHSLRDLSVPVANDLYVVDLEYDFRDLTTPSVSETGLLVDLNHRSVDFSLRNISETDYLVNIDHLSRDLSAPILQNSSDYIVDLVSFSVDRSAPIISLENFNVLSDTDLVVTARDLTIPIISVSTYNASVDIARRDNTLPPPADVLGYSVDLSNINLRDIITTPDQVDLGLDVNDNSTNRSNIVFITPTYGSNLRYGESATYTIPGDSGAAGLKDAASTDTD